MSWIEIFFSAVSNILNIYIDFRVMKLFVSKKEVPVAMQTAVYFVVWLGNCITYLFWGNMYWITASLALLLLSAAFLLYDGSVIRKLTAVVSAIALGVLFEEIIWRVLIWFGESSPNRAAGSLLSSFWYLVFILAVEHFFCINRVEQVSKSIYFNIFLLLFGSVVLVEVLAKFNDRYELILMGLSAVCLVNVSTFYLYDKVNEVYRKTLEHKVLEEQIAMHENQSALMRQSQENIRSLWHDMKNHLLLLDVYISQGEYEKASQYIKNIQSFLYVPGQYANSGNQEVDAILNYRLGKAEKMGCQIETKLKVPDTSFMSDFDLNMLLGNLLDNALEALEHAEKKYLSVELKYEKGILVIRICNSFDGIVEQDGRAFATRKQDRENHGWGLRNVERVVKKYQGEQVIQAEGALFKTSVILYVTTG